MAAVVDEAERRARIVLSRVCEPGDRDGCELVHEHSGVELLRRLRAGPLPRAGSKVAGWCGRAEAADLASLLRVADAVGARYVCPGDSEWPAAVQDLDRPTESSDRRGGVPFGLWLRGGGDLGALVRRSVAVVGSRAATAYGERVAGEIAYDCGSLGVTVVSGGAYGIDAAAHRGALARESGGVAVLAGGIDRLYPTGNAQLLRSIATSGVLVSEAAPGYTPSRSRFLVRNRLIAALTQGTVVVEAALRSGSLNTARWAQDLARGVMGVPGPVTSMSSAGVHELLRQPETLLVTDAREIVEHISASGEGLAPRKQGPRRLGDDLSQITRLVREALPVERPSSAEAVAVVAGVATAEALRCLVELHALGLAQRVESGWLLASGDVTLDGEGMA